MRFLPLRQASSAASLRRFASSAPVKPTVVFAMTERSTSASSGDTFSYYIETSVLIENDIIKSIMPRITQDQSDDPDANVTYFGYAVNGRTRRGVNYPGIPAQILEKQSVDGVDVVTGATYSSNSILKAVKDALNMARTR